MIFPQPKYPTKPCLSIRSLGFNKTSTPAIENAGKYRHITSGRSAIALALKYCGLGGDDTVLIPAYHCTSMIDPVIWCGATPKFYKINENTDIDIDSIKKLITENTKIIIVVHYFGFMQNLELLRTICTEKGIFLIEDCAHCCFGKEVNGEPVGSIGDFAIASPMKFYPVYDGGVLASSKYNVDDIELLNSGIKFQAKSIVNNIEFSIKYNRLWALKVVIQPLFLMKDFLWSIIKKADTEGKENNIGPASSDGGYGFDPQWNNKKISLFSRFIMCNIDTSRIVNLRRKYYKIYNDELSNLNGCKPLFKYLPDDVVPYVFPLVVYSDPKNKFNILKMKGIPILRFGEYLWDSVDENTCANSISLSETVFQFPCHQELKKSEVMDIINEVKKLFNYEENNQK